MDVEDPSSRIRPQREDIEEEDDELEGDDTVRSLKKKPHKKHVVEKSDPK